MDVEEEEGKGEKELAGTDEIGGLSRSIHSSKSFEKNSR